MTDCNFIRSEVEAIYSGASRTWGQIAHVLLLVERSGCFKEETTYRARQRIWGMRPQEWGMRPQSFTEWTRSFARGSGISLSTLWRFVSAGRNYEKLVTIDPISKHPKAKVPLSELPDDFSAESIEILAKIGRVAPQNEFANLALKLLDREVTRSELRRIWQAFRPVLEGETARGQKKLLVSKEIHLHPNYFEALACNALLMSEGQWLGPRDPKQVRVFFNVALGDDVPQPISYEFGAVVAVKEGETDVILHGIQIVTTHQAAAKLSETLLIGTRLCHLMWVVVQDDLLSFVGDMIPNHVGILSVDQNKIQVFRIAEKTKAASKDLYLLTKSILASLL